MGQHGEVAERPRSTQMQGTEELKQRLASVLGERVDTSNFVSTIAGKDVSFAQLALALGEFLLGDGNVCHVSKVDQIIEVVAEEQHRDFLLLLVGKIVNQIISE